MKIGAYYEGYILFNPKDLGIEEHFLEDGEVIETDESIGAVHDAVDQAIGDALKAAGLGKDDWFGIQFTSPLKE